MRSVDPELKKKHQRLETKKRVALDAEAVAEQPRAGKRCLGHWGFLGL